MARREAGWPGMLLGITSIPSGLWGAGLGKARDLGRGGEILDGEVLVDTTETFSSRREETLTLGKRGARRNGGRGRDGARLQRELWTRGTSWTKRS